MTDEQSQTYTELAVAIGRIEEGVKSVKEVVDGVANTQKTHGDTLTRHEVDIEILKSRQQPRIHWITVIVGIVAIAAFALALFDRLYQ